MKIQLNGKQTEVNGPISLAELLKSLEVTPELVACELNHRIVRRSDYASTFIKENDELEILRMIGGG